MIDTSIGDLERQLLIAPFDSRLRLDYGIALQAGGRHEDALRQFALLESKGDLEAEALTAAARSLLSLGRTDEALSKYASARSKPGFSVDAGLEEAGAAARKTAPVRLSVMRGAGGASTGADNVVPIGRAARERVLFDDIAGLDDLKRTVRLQIIEPFRNPNLFAKFRKKAGGGVLLYGPPGCGKTMLAKAVAGECHAEFISVGLSDVLSMWIGQSEQNLQQLFEKARSKRPSVLFLDELDGLAFARSKANSEHTRQTVNELLSQLDGFASDNTGILILAASNMPWDVDPALKRPGRFARQVFVSPPDEVARADILRMKLGDAPQGEIDTRAIARMTPHFSGADIEGVVELAKEYALEDHLLRGVDRPIEQQDLVNALGNARASTLEWLRTARNLVKYGGADDTYREVGEYLRKHKLY